MSSSFHVGWCFSYVCLYSLFLPFPKASARFCTVPKAVTAVLNGSAMHDANVVRMFREHIAKTRNPESIRILCDLLGALLREDDAEIALRVKLIRNRCKLLFAQPDHDHSQEATRVPQKALLPYSTPH
jgi:hypothetical protein